MPDEALSVREVAQRTGLSVRDVRRRADPSHPDHIPCFRPMDARGHYRPQFRPEDVEAWLAERTR